jgi:DNA-binding HxlR family transcriptional regulator
MSDQKFRVDCAPRRVLELFGSKWTSMILHSLHALPDGYARPGALQRSLLGISKKMLTQTLREMEASGLIERKVISVMPPEVEYRLSPLGLRFVEPVQRLYDWAIENADALDEMTPRAEMRRVARETSGES